jgi:alkylation response protein AidB-like acyl-CoA dehydrogenase
MGMDEEQKKLAEELLSSGETKPSFAKLLALGIFKSSLVFPYPKEQESNKTETQSFLKMLNEALDQHLKPYVVDKEANIPPELIKIYGESGLLGMSVPKEYGGLGMSQTAYCQAIEAVASRCGGSAVFINAHQSIGLKGILLFGTDIQKKQLLPALAKGENIAAFSLTEENAGSDANGVETRAVYDPEKKVYRINGRKQWTTNGSIAKILTVMAKTEVNGKQGKQDRVTAFLVTSDMPGFSIENPALEKVGIRGTRTANLIFKDVEVPEKNVLGDLGGGLKICLTCLDYGRTTFGAMCTGAAKYCLKRAVEHAKNRLQFKQTLSSFPLVKEKIAKMSALVYAMDASTYLTAGLIDEGVEDVMLESALLKVFASDALWDIIYDTMQIFGGRSFFTTEPFERMMRDARLNMIGEGSNEVLRVFIGVVIMREAGLEIKNSIDDLKHPIKNICHLTHLLSGFVRHMSKIQIPVRSAHIRNEANQLSKAIKQFRRDILLLLKKHREGIIEKQFDLNRIANCAIALYTMSAVISKIDSDLMNASDRPEALGNDLARAKLYCTLASQKIRDNHLAIDENIDQQIEELSDTITGLQKS